MFKILKFCLLGLLITLSLGQDDDDIKNVCSEEDPEYCFGEITIDNDQIARTNDYTYNQLNHDLKKIKIPKNFDAREHWPQCKEIISRIKSQKACGNCWAYATTMALADRVCIANNGTNDVKKLDFSIVDVSVCCDKCRLTKTSSCMGGLQPYAIKFFINTGAILEECKKFDLDVLKREPRCEQKCDNKNEKFEDNIHKATKGFQFDKVEELDQIKYEIMTYGPITCSSVITKNFPKWHSKGVFKEKDAGAPIPNAGHALRVVGWGHEDDVDYWLIANSWSQKWGDKGFAKVDMTNNVLSTNKGYYGIYTEPMARFKPTQPPPTTSLSSITDNSAGSPSTIVSPTKYLIFKIIVFVFWYVQE